MPAARVKCDNSDLKEAVKDLRDNGYTNEKISREIGVRIDSCLYRGHKMSLESFEKLSNISNRHIEHHIVEDDRYNENTIPKLTENEKLAELIGIILGDGHIQHENSQNNNRNNSTYFISVTLNENEKKIIERTRKLIQETTKLEPKTYKKKGNCVRVVVHGKNVVEKFQEKGLEPGHKTEKQVSTPNWIKKSTELSSKCLKGLIDTDGAIYKDKRKNKSYTRIQFKNYSKPLLKDFKTMCSKHNIKTVKGGPHQIQISRKHIEKFIKNIRPIKAQKIQTT